MITQTKQNDFTTTLFGRTRRAVLTLLYGHANEAFYLRQIVRTTGLGLGPVQRELKQLTDAGIVRRTMEGRQAYYQVNPDLPVFNELKSLAAWMGKNQPQITTFNKGMFTLRERFPLSRRRLAEFCRKHYIKKLSLFGSVLREDFRPDSDVDVLVEFEEGHVPGFGMVAIEDELAQLVGRKVDLRTPGEISRYFRDEVLRGAKVCYGAA